MSKQCWKTLQHDGVLFPPPYRPINSHRASLKVSQKGSTHHTVLPPQVEEITVAFARTQKRLMDAGQYDGALRDKIETNFWTRGFSSMVPPKIREEAERISPKFPVRALDFSDFLPKVSGGGDGSGTTSTAAADEDLIVGAVAMVDGVRQPVGNVMMEKAGVFMGRGGASHPLMGSPKPRVLAKDITLNLSAEAKVPRVPNGGGSKEWGAIVHEPCARWLAKWRDPVTRKQKYVWLGSASERERKSERVKFDHAVELRKYLPALRDKIVKDLQNSDEETRQLAICAWIIDTLAIRVGSDQDAKDHGVYGATTLLMKHVTPHYSPSTIDIRFLGKDSIPFEATLSRSKESNVMNDEEDRTTRYHATGYDALLKLRTNRSHSLSNGDGRLFHLISATKLNQYLGAASKGSKDSALTAKVLRTVHASRVFKSTLDKIRSRQIKLNNPQIGLELASARAAMHCNHRRAPDASHAKEKETVRRAAESQLLSDVSMQRWKDISQVKEAIRDAGLNPSTTRSNYVDPRIAIEYCSKYGADVRGDDGKTQKCDPLPTLALRKKHAWARKKNK